MAPRKQWACGGVHDVGGADKQSTHVIAKPQRQHRTSSFSCCSPPASVSGVAAAVARRQCELMMTAARCAECYAQWSSRCVDKRRHFQVAQSMKFTNRRIYILTVLMTYYAASQYDVVLSDRNTFSFSQSELHIISPHITQASSISSLSPFTIRHSFAFSRQTNNSILPRILHIIDYLLHPQTFFHRFFSF